LLSNKKYEQAIKCFIQAIKAHPKNYDARYLKGVTEFDLQNYDNAVKVFFN